MKSRQIAKLRNQLAAIQAEINKVAGELNRSKRSAPRHPDFKPSPLRGKIQKGIAQEVREILEQQEQENGND